MCMARYGIAIFLESERIKKAKYWSVAICPYRRMIPTGRLGACLSDDDEGYEEELDHDISHASLLVDFY